MLRIAICDDDVCVANRISDLLRECLDKQDVACEIEVFYDGFPVFEDFKAGLFFDLLLLDIEMKKMNGLELAKKIKAMQKNVKIIYISSYDEYIRDLFEFQPIGFIDKPIDEGILKKKVVRVCYEILKEKTEHIDFFEFYFRKASYRIPIDKICFFESRGRKVYIRQEHQEQQFIGKLDLVENKLSKSEIPFLRVHQSYLVNYQYIKRLSSEQIELLDGTKINIAEKRKQQVKQEIKKIIEANYDD